ncbi:hypothetical protein ACFYOR_06175 [Streptomyces griseofuscus]|uniref:hypothetical protein n=1 Tax=Streptomyces griseofuscus TaxID=146922 RepID=UPI0036B932CC
MLNELGVGEAVGGERRKRTGDADEDEVDGAFCPQQPLVRNLIRIFLHEGDDLRFGARDVSPHDIDTGRPVVRYRDDSGSAHTLTPWPCWPCTHAVSPRRPHVVRTRAGSTSSARSQTPPVPAKGPITSKQVVPLRGVVFSPMSHGRPP